MDTNAIKEVLRNDALLRHMTLTAILAGDTIKEYRSDEKAEEKGDAYLGHHAIVTAQDLASQAIILQKLSKNYFDATFIAEEKQEGDLAQITLTSENYKGHLPGRVFGVDSLDGTSQKDRELYEWAVSIGVMDDMNHNAGVIYAPQINGGLIVFGSRISGVYLAEGNRAPQRIGPVAGALPRAWSESTVQFGVDMSHHAQLHHLHHIISKEVRTSNVNGSCALGLALVAANRIEAFVQPTQRVWDYHAGIALVRESGKQILFYRHKNGERSDFFAHSLPTDYNPESKNLGFIAGTEDAINRIMDEFDAHFPAKLDIYGKLLS